MLKKLSKYGNSLALLIDRPILELLGIDENTQLKIRVEGKKITIEPIKNDKKSGIISDDEKLQKIYEKLVEKYGPALKKLSKN